MGSIFVLSSSKRGVKYSIVVMDVFNKYACVKPLKYKKAKKFLYGFIEIVNESYRQPNKLWVNQGKKFYNNLIQKWLDDNDILMYSAHHEGKSVVAERFIKTLKIKICKKMPVNNKKPYLSYLD